MTILHSEVSSAPQAQHEESNMNKMAIFLGGFLALTILIGLLATISPV